MTMIPGLVRRTAIEAERHLREGAREGVRLLGRLGRDLERVEEIGRLLPALAERIRALEESVRAREAELAGLRAEVDSLVGQLNDRVLPRIDERMDDTERDLTAVAASLIRNGRDTAAGHARLDSAERRLGDLRTKLGQMEQRAGLWRDVQASVARLGDDVDALLVGAARDSAVGERAALRPAGSPAPVPDPVPDHAPPVAAEHAAEHVTDRPA
ncbi:hypothetical protein [Actinomadura litoris]|uniref:hypothetical protein n=1 Tax=Actinomadura litoris TaxID=2678616 RepID=UPI001FA780A8|nr:hypothetical protein [Actinomadura litoris]